MRNKIPVLENLKHIRNQGRKGNCKGKDFRFRLNSWSRFKLQNMIDYKSRCNGIIPVYVSPKGTSSKCPMCGSKLEPEENREMHCSVCDRRVDRDINASQNILYSAIRSMADAPQVEALKQFKDAEQNVASQVVPL